MVPGSRILFGDYEVDFATHQLFKQGTRIALQHKPFRVLELLLRRHGQLVTRQELFAHLWPDSHVSYERGLNSAVNSLRLAMGDSSRHCHYIETRPGLGYTFVAPIRRASRPTNPEAYQDCLKGRYLLDRLEEDETYKALAYFNSAAADDSCAALAHAGIADCYCQLALMASVSCSDASHPARSSSELAIRRNPELTDAHLSAARVRMLFDWDWPGAHNAIRHALNLDANSVSAHILSASLSCILGECNSALAACRHVLEMEPLSMPANLQLATCLHAARDFEAAANQCWKMLSLWPNFGPAHLLLALAHQQSAMYEEAVLEFHNALPCSACRIPAIAGLCHLFELTGMRDKAEQTFLELAGYQRVSCYWKAVVAAGQRDQLQTLSLLEQCNHHRDPALLGLTSDARFQFVEDTPRFKMLAPANSLLLVEA